MDAYLHLAGYRFARLSGLQELKSELLAFCQVAELCGSILLSEEGINFYVAGRSAAAEKLLEKLRALPGLDSLTARRSSSTKRPYDRMRVKIKREIIAFGVAGVDPAGRPSPKLSPRELKEWLDEGREITLLDTRNNYEIHSGTFKGAVPADIDHFRDFPGAARRLPSDWKTRPIVMFCTGGIRCEKAGPFMQGEGFTNVFQLDGGILRYFEECGNAHFEGECFVFDQRVGLDTALKETESILCPRCQLPVTVAKQSHADYTPGVSCPDCAKRTFAEQRIE
ncbi:MAG: hypothetical protein KBA71_08455 [Opitutaceae bacterium]|nr:hypothetical protein [Opitutaceae bacterium]